MASTVKNKSRMQPKPLRELLPALRGLVSKETIMALSPKTQPSTTLRTYKPLTIAELRSQLLVLERQSSRRPAPPDAPTKKKKWNSSVKPQSSSATIKHVETPFPKPKLGAKKSLQIQSKTNIGTQQTSVVENKLLKNRLTKQKHFNKEKSSNLSNLNKKKVASPKPLGKPVRVPIPGTSLSNMSFKLNSDGSFLQRKEKNNDIKEKTKTLMEEPILETTVEVSPPVSTPIKEYRNIKEFFSHANSVLDNDTIMSFSKDSENKENSSEESVIVSLCDLLNKAIVNADSLEVEKQIEDEIRMIENAIQILQNIKESHLKSLQYVKRFKGKNVEKNKENKKETTLVTVACQTETVNKNNISLARNPILRPSVIKTQPPSYKIPKKNSCLRKSVS